MIRATLIGCMALLAACSQPVEPYQPPEIFGRFTSDPFSMIQRAEPVLTPEGQAWVDDFTPDKDPALLCVEAGTAHILFQPNGVIVEQLENGDLKLNDELVYMDGREFPADIELTKPGYSIGYWDGDALYVETRALKGGDILTPYWAPYKPSDALELKRKYYLVALDQRWAALGVADEEVNPLQLDNGRTIQMDLWLTDPNVYAETWHTTKQYRELRSDLLDEDLPNEWGANSGVPQDFIDNYSGDCVLFDDYASEADEILGVSE